MKRRARRSLVQTGLLATALLALPAATQAQFTYITNNGAITITGYTGPGGDVTIPSIINGYPVTSIGSFGFYNINSLAAITIPNGVTNIERGAFEYSSLTSVTIPNSVADISGEAFYGCSQLTAITVDTQNPFYSSVNGVLFDKNQATLIRYPAGVTGSYAIPNSVTNIGYAAFDYCADLTVSIPNSVINIGESAFVWSGLKSIIIPNSVASIGVLAFWGCTGLTNIVIPNSVTNIGNEAFEDCGLTSVTIGNSVSTTGNGAFEGCSNLTNVTIGNSVSTIGNGAFANCGLTSVTIPNNVTNIGVLAFGNCYKLASIYFMGGAPETDVLPFSLYDEWGVSYGFDSATVYYLPNTVGWSNTFAGLPTALWLPQAQTGDANFGVRSNQFGFNINWASGQTVVVEACTNLANPVWSSVATNTLTSNSSYFSDPQWSDYPAHFYRLRSP